MKAGSGVPRKNPGSLGPTASETVCAVSGTTTLMPPEPRSAARTRSACAVLPKEYDGPAIRYERLVSSTGLPVGSVVVTPELLIS